MIREHILIPILHALVMAPIFYFFVTGVINYYFVRKKHYLGDILKATGNAISSEEFTTKLNAIIDRKETKDRDQNTA